MADTRMVFFDGDVTTESIAHLRAQLIAHHNADPQAEVTIVINSLGGSSQAAIGLGHFVRHVLPQLKIKTIATGIVASAAVILFMMGQRRLMVPHAQIWLHQAQVQPSSVDDPKQTPGLPPSTKNLAVKYDEMFVSFVASTIGGIGANMHFSIGSLMGQNWIGNAVGAKKLGLATGILRRPRVAKKKIRSTRA